MSTTTIKEKVQLDKFSGKKEDWDIWSIQFLARASKYNYDEYLTNESTPRCAADNVKALSTADITLRALNKAACNDLILHMNVQTAAGKVAFNEVKLAKTNDLQGGDAKLAWKKLKMKYEVDVEDSFRVTNYQVTRY